MTNEEKAEEIALKYARTYIVSKNDSHKHNILFKESSIIECEKASLETAKWKDEQLETEKQALIDKACEWLSIHDNYSTPTHVLVEQLRQAMKGGNNE